MLYYLIKIKNIPEDGYDLTASSDSDEWFKKIFNDLLSDAIHSFDATLSAKIVKVDKTLDVTGGVYLRLNVACSRCLTDFNFEQQIPFRFLMEPAPDDAHSDVAGDNDEEIDESLDFSYYHGDNVDIGDLIRQNVMTAQPISYICSDSCKGLCPKCGKNLNKGPCKCRVSSSDSPFAVLKQLKRLTTKSKT